jgi:ureidoglycolate hydrolase
VTVFSFNESRDRKTTMRTLVIEPLTKEAFAPFGDVIETDGSDHFMINNGSTMRFHRLESKRQRRRTRRLSVSSVPKHWTCR